MMTRVLPARHAGEWEPAAEEAAALLRRGGLVALPTETVYGLGCDALNPAAAAGVFAAKERPTFDPLIVHVPAASWIGDLVSASEATGGVARRLSERFWPGPLTLVLPSQAVVPDLVRAGLPTVALRCSAHPVMAVVLQKLGGPVAAPSANRFGRISPVTAAHVLEELAGRIPLVLDGGPCRHGLESTIVAVEDERLVLLRPGPVTAEELGEFAPVVRAERGEKLAAPGMLDRHYAPRTPLRIWREGAPPPEDAAECGLLDFGTGAEGFAVVENLSSDPGRAAPEFFASLRRLDAAGVRGIYARTIPDSGLGMAIMDRLRRASHE